MIPYKLKIQGVRDYSPRIIEFGEPDEHILITGPNGVGKSTLTFCLGAVLYSSKVEIEGLRSTNLKDNEPWYAKITLIFLNEGPTRIDGPKYIAFQLTINQDVKNGPIQRDYEVLNGDDEQSLASHARYVSGGVAGRNFSAYREDLQVRYKIEPDLYYLIWYQQEVNQFAAMYPEERFRKFSDMFNISDIQKDWEASLEQIKEVQSDIERFRSTQKSAEIMLNAAKTELDRYLNNKKRLIESGQQYYTLLHKIIAFYEQSIERKATTKTEMAVQKEQLIVDLQQLKVELKQLNNEHNSMQQQLAALEEELQTLESNVTTEQQQQTKLKEQKNKLQQQLEAVADKRKFLMYDEETTRQMLVAITEQLQETNVQLNTNKQESNKKRQQERELNNEESTLTHSLQHLQLQITEAQKLKDIHKSSAFIGQQIEHLQHQQQTDFETMERLKHEQQSMLQQMKQLELKKFVSKRQQQGLQHLQQQQLEAYPLRELLELMPTAPIAYEQRFEPIKYTIFYVGKNYKPLNDLYYVSLNELVPTESISRIPELGLQIRSDLNDRQANYANKALWWVKQFFISSPKIEQQLLVDSRGVRGAQEASQYILSDPAIENLLTQAKTDYGTISTKLAEVKSRYEANQQQLKVLASNVIAMQHAESTLLKHPELETIKTRLEQIAEKLSAVYDEQNELEQEFTTLQNKLAQDDFQRGQLQKQCQIYDELGAFAEQQLQLQQLEVELKQLQKKIASLKNRRDELENTMRDKKRGLANFSVKLQQKEIEHSNIESSITALDLKIKKVLEELESDDAMKSRFELELVELDNVLPIEALVLSEQYDAISNLSHLQSLKDQVMASFNNARSEQVNENAQENYDVQKKEYDKKAAELVNAEQLLESNTIRANELEDRLETTITMHLTTINDLFQQYMDVFQFEGQIEKERIEEKNGRVKFLLYIKARKHGHKGTLEDVSMKARSGKVGKGVSGGEESLSSLLFALALLRNLSISPGYIVLDEFDSALDDERKNKVFNLYAEELQRKLIIVSPKGHDEAYYNCFSKVYIVEHDASIPKSTIRGIQNKRQ